ncbi:MAG: alpha/beta fold hydrolase [Tepidiformaceae bacterium]
MFRGSTRPKPHEQVLKLGDGRLLGYTEYGDPGGAPVVYFHGWPGSRLEAAPWDPAAKAGHVRLIAFDRPGYGLSDFQPGRTISDWPADVAECADMLGLGDFAVAGYSGGGPYALACGLSLASRVTRVAVVSSPVDVPSAALLAGMSRGNRTITAFARRCPWALPVPLGALALVVRHFPGLTTGGIPKADRALFETVPGLRAALLGSQREAFRHGVKGAAEDGALLVRPWALCLPDIRTRVLLWHGEADTSVPPAMGEYLAAQLPNCTAQFVPGAGHLWGPANGATVLDALVNSG